MRRLRPRPRAAKKGPVGQLGTADGDKSLAASLSPMSRPGRDRAVYSSEHGRLCAQCGRPSKRCSCPTYPRRAASKSTGDGIARVGRTSKGRGGKTVTTITGLQVQPDDLAALARDLKRLCGTGGSVKAGVIEIQGDRREEIMQELARREIPAKRSGG